jgi:hypothetical protein
MSSSSPPSRPAAALQGWSDILVLGWRLKEYVSQEHSKSFMMLG